MYAQLTATFSAALRSAGCQSVIHTHTHIHTYILIYTIDIYAQLTATFSAALRSTGCQNVIHTHTHTYIYTDIYNRYVRTANRDVLGRTTHYGRTTLGRLSERHTHTYTYTYIYTDTYNRYVRTANLDVLGRTTLGRLSERRNPCRFSEGSRIYMDCDPCVYSEQIFQCRVQIFQYLLSINYM
jgi:hypothetical protein